MQGAIESSFNSTMVRLEAPCAIDFIVVSASFNSTMVRLEGAVLIKIEAKLPFQFHDGAIRRIQDGIEYDFRNVSIPRWCD